MTKAEQRQRAKARKVLHRLLGDERFPLGTRIKMPHTDGNIWGYIHSYFGDVSYRVIFDNGYDELLTHRKVEVYRKSHTQYKKEQRRMKRK